MRLSEVDFNSWYLRSRNPLNHQVTTVYQGLQLNAVIAHGCLCNFGSGGVVRGRDRRSYLSVLASWLTQHTQARAQWLVQDKFRREELYKEFIDDASRAYLNALQHDKAEMPVLISLYAKIGKMRVLSSPDVVESAQQVAHKIVDTYLEPEKNFIELREMVNDRSIDLLNDFSEACRREFELLRVRLFSMSGG